MCIGTYSQTRSAYLFTSLDAINWLVKVLCMNTSNRQQFDTVDCTSCVLVLLTTKLLLEFKTQPVSVTERSHSARHGKRGVAGSIHYDIYFHFGIFACFPFLTTSVNPVQMKSSMTFIQSNGCIEIDLIFTKFGGSTYDVTSALKYYCRYYYKAPVV